MSEKNRSRENIIEQWRIEPDSASHRDYIVTQYEGDVWACSCPGWIFKVPRRDCKHIGYVKAGGAVAIDPLLRAIHESIRKADQHEKRKGASV